MYKQTEDLEKTKEKQNTGTKRTVHGRRLGRPLGATRREALKTLLPALQLPEDKITEQGNLDPRILFPRNGNNVIFEIGFGNGEHLSTMMERNPGNLYIGAEPFVGGMSAFLKDIKDRDHGNILVWMNDALAALRSLTADSLDEIYILNPDPWPKKRHWNRRIVRPETLDIFARVLKPGGRLTMTTDVDDLAGWMAAHAENHPGFHWLADACSDWQTPPPGWLPTRYEQKGQKAGRRQSYLLFERKIS